VRNLLWREQRKAVKKQLQLTYKESLMGTIKAAIIRAVHQKIEVTKGYVTKGAKAVNHFIAALNKVTVDNF
jgi:hypothetical protein